MQLNGFPNDDILIYGDWRSSPEGRQLRPGALIASHPHLRRTEARKLWAINRSDPLAGFGKEKRPNKGFPVDLKQSAESFLRISRCDDVNE
jgi:hypothetical protein